VRLQLEYTPYAKAAASKEFLQMGFHSPRASISFAGMSCLIQVVRKPDLIVIQLVGEAFCLQSIQEMRICVEGLMDSDETRPIAICTDGLSLVGSSCLSGIIETAFEIRKHKIPAFIAEARPDVLDVFNIASLHSILPIYDTLEDGMEAVSKN